MRKIFFISLVFISLFSQRVDAYTGSVCFTNFTSFTKPTPDCFMGYNPQTGTTHTVAAGDNGSLTTFDNASPIAVTLPQAQNIPPVSGYSTSGIVSFYNGWSFVVYNSGLGLVTITPTTSTINDEATFTLAAGQGAQIVSSGGNYTATRSGVVSTSSIAPQATNTILGNATSGTAAPTALAIGSCSTASSALIWTTNTGFGCNTSITSAAVPVGGITGTGTGVISAMSINVGTVGAFITNGGALGTPSSGTLTNATGLPISTGVSGLGTGVATALSVNVGTAGSFVVNGGALGSPSSAGTIPAYTLGGTISGGGNQINNVIIGTTSPLAGTFTTLAATSATDTSSLSTGASIITGGQAVNKSLRVGDTVFAGLNNAAYITFSGNAGGGSDPYIRGTGAANTGLQFWTDGTGNFAFRTGGSLYTQLMINNTTSAANHMTITGGTNPNLGVSGGNLSITPAVVGGSYIQTTATTVGGLTACAAGLKGARHFVTDSNAVSYTAGIGAIVAAGGATNVPVVCDGTNWRIG